MAFISDTTIEKLLTRVDIDGWENGGREMQELVDHTTGKVFARIPKGTKEDVLRAEDRARIAQKKWAKVAPADRAKIIFKFADLVHKNRNWLMDIAQAETGKARIHITEELIDVLLVSRYYAKRAPKWLKDEKIAGPLPLISKGRVTHNPVGIVGVVAPWNYPMSLSASDSVPAILAGNAMIIKPDSNTPLSALAIATLMDKAGLPEHLWQVITGPGTEVGSTLTDTADFMMFTGSSRTGKAMGEQLGSRLVGFSAELGGKNAMIVDEGVDYERVAEIATRACFSNAGQLCIGIERIYAVGSAYEDFTKVLVDRLERMKIGVGREWEIEMGSLINKKQLDTVQDHLDDAVAKGARILTGGKHRPDLGPFVFEPTLLADVPEDAICYRGETFGPINSIYPAKSIEDAVEQANDTDYGLNTSIFCKDKKEAQWVADQVNTGQVNVGEGYGIAWATLDGPSGGWGDSGKGYRHSKDGLMKYTKSKTIATVNSAVLHLGGPKFLPTKIWGPVYEQLSNMMKYMP